MDTAFSADELRDAARLARDCPVMGQAVALARWIGTGHRPLTAGQVLRKADVPTAGAAPGVDVPPKLRTMADIPALHRPWCAGVGVGLLRVRDEHVTGGPALEHWPPGEADLLAGWLAGLRAVCAAESRPHDEDSVRLLALALLMVIGQKGVRLTISTWSLVSAALYDLCDSYDKSFSEAHSVAYRYHGLDRATPLAGLVGLLAGFGAVGGEHGKTVQDVTSVGGKITYTYDFGTEWRHEIILEKTLARDPGQDYPVCVAFRGDSPVEYWSEDDPAEPEPFDLSGVNRKLAALTEQGSPS